MRICLFFLLLSVLPLMGADLGKRRDFFVIDGIAVKGLKKVEKEAIQEKLRSRLGMKLDNYLLHEDIQRIYQMQYFESVEAHHIRHKGKNILQFRVKEKPIIARIVFDGNTELDRDDLLGQVKSKEFSILDVNTIKNDVILLQKQYEEKGYYLASVSYSLKPLSTEGVELVFEIKEYDQVRVKKITFLGNKSFSDDELKGIMMTSEESFFSFLSGSGNFKDFDFQMDVERLKYFYRTKGYLQVDSATPEITVSEDKKWIFITVRLNEGPQFVVNNIQFQGEVLFEEKELLEKISLKSGEVYSEERYQRDVQLLTELYQDKGYAFANVLRNLHPLPGENKVDVDFSFEKGKIAYFGKISVKGNSKTRDKVVRRELFIKEGSRFSGSALRRSKENVTRLGFFDPGSVVFNTVTPKGRDDVIDVEITVKETSTGQISMGAGYSTASGFFGQASVAEKNFRGLGQDLSLSFTLSSETNIWNVGFMEPYLFDTKWTGGGDVFYSNNSTRDSFTYMRYGFDVRVGYPIFEYTRLFLTYKLEYTKLTDSKDPTIKDETENGLASSLRSTLVHDRRNNRMQPTAGHYISYSTEFAGLGGDKNWLKNEFDTRFYHKVIGDLVFRTRLNIQKLDRINNNLIPRTEKFVLGGSRNLRGYNFEDVGPMTDPDTDGVIYNKGGLFSLVTQFEFEHPLAREAGLKWVVFFDAGNIYNKYFGADGNFDLVFDYGFGFRWFSPIGILRFEFGYPLGDSVPNSKGMKFHFDIGQVF